MSKQTKKSDAPKSEAQKEMRRLMSAGWKLSHIAKAVGIGSGAANLWVKGGGATERFMVPLRALPTTPADGKPMVNKLEAPIVKELEVELARRVKKAKKGEHLDTDDLNAHLDELAVVEAVPEHVHPDVDYGPRLTGIIKVTGRAQASALARVLRIDAEELERAGQLRFEF